MKKKYKHNLIDDDIIDFIESPDIQNHLLVFELLKGRGMSLTQFCKQIILRDIEYGIMIIKGLKLEDAKKLSVKYTETWSKGEWEYSDIQMINSSILDINFSITQRRYANEGTPNTYRLVVHTGTGVHPVTISTVSQMFANNQHIYMNKVLLDIIDYVYDYIHPLNIEEDEKE
jgi:hypothetical protein